MKKSRSVIGWVGIVLALVLTVGLMVGLLAPNDSKANFKNWFSKDVPELGQVVKVDKASFCNAMIVTIEKSSGEKLSESEKEDMSSGLVGITIELKTDKLALVTILTSDDYDEAHLLNSSEISGTGMIYKYTVGDNGAITFKFTFDGDGEEASELVIVGNYDSKSNVMNVVSITGDAEVV